MRNKNADSNYIFHIYVVKTLYKHIKMATICVKYLFSMLVIISKHLKQYIHAKKYMISSIHESVSFHIITFHGHIVKTFHQKMKLQK